MKLTILLIFLIGICVNSEWIPLVSVEDMFPPLGYDRIDGLYNIKLDIANKDKDKFYLRNRKVGVYPQVESGPGDFKAEHKKRSPDFLIQKFKKLLEMKKKMDGEA